MIAPHPGQGPQFFPQSQQGGPAQLPLQPEEAPVILSVAADTVITRGLDAAVSTVLTVAAAMTLYLGVASVAACLLTAVGAVSLIFGPAAAVTLAFAAAALGGIRIAAASSIALLLLLTGQIGILPNWTIVYSGRR